MNVLFNKMLEVMFIRKCVNIHHAVLQGPLSGQNRQIVLWSKTSDVIMDAVMLHQQLCNREPAIILWNNPAVSILHVHGPWHTKPVRRLFKHDAQTKPCLNPCKTFLIVSHNIRLNWKKVLMKAKNWNHKMFEIKCSTQRKFPPKVFTWGLNAKPTMRDRNQMQHIFRWDSCRVDVGSPLSPQFLIWLLTHNALPEGFVCLRQADVAVRCKRRPPPQLDHITAAEQQEGRRLTSPVGPAGCCLSLMTDSLLLFSGGVLVVSYWNHVWLTGSPRSVLMEENCWRSWIWPSGLKALLFVVSAAIEGPGMGGMKLPIGMTRRALSYDDNLEAPMSTPPHDININNLWRRPIIPERRFTHLAEVRRPPHITHTLYSCEYHVMMMVVMPCFPL